MLGNSDACKKSVNKVHIKGDLCLATVHSFFLHTGPLDFVSTWLYHTPDLVGYLATLGDTLIDPGV